LGLQPIEEKVAEPRSPEDVPTVQAAGWLCCDLKKAMWVTYREFIKVAEEDEGIADPWQRAPGSARLRPASARPKLQRSGNQEIDWAQEEVIVPGTDGDGLLDIDNLPRTHVTLLEFASQSFPF
ncbi:unnamed protein product, partial [Chrysoparadoxa australica]